MLCIAVNGITQATTAVIKPVQPIQYKNENGKFQILSYIKEKCLSQPSLKCYVNDQPVELIKTEQSDSLLVWLPMIGENEQIKVSAGKKIILDQTFQPFIPADWGYFKHGVIHIIQSSHQDIAWMDTPEYCREDRIHNIIIPALDMMKQNKRFTFEMEQTLNLMEFLEKYPERKEELIQLYKEKRFTWGATYNQPYEGLSSGEQLVRQSYYGRKWIHENMPGCDDLVANNIDVPGRTLQMAQILSKSGIPNLFISRMAEGLYDWYSPDGSKVLTFSPGNYGWASLIWKFFDQDAATALHKLHHRTQLWSDYYEKHQIPPHYAILMSCDATKPVDYQNVIDEWNKIAEASEIPLPRLKSSTSEEYFASVRGEGTQFEKISGERPNLWLYIHGPAHYKATKYKRDAALLLPAAESFTTLSLLQAGNLQKYPRKTFDRAWMASIYPDHGLGGKNGEITDSIFEDSLRVSYELGQKLLSDALKQLTEQIQTKENNLVVFNDLTWDRNGLVTIEVPDEKVSIKDEQGNLVKAQIKKDSDGKQHVIFEAQDIPSMGYRSYSIHRGKRVKTSLPETVKQLSNQIENDYYKAVLGDGGITYLYDKQLGKEIVHTSKFACGDIIELGYTGNGAGEFTRITDVVPGDIVPLSSFVSKWEIIESGALYTRFRNSQPTQHTTIIQDITFYHTTKKIDFDITLQDFDGTHNRQYRIAFPTNIMGERTINYEVPMAVAQVGKDELKKKPGGWAWGGSYVHHPEDSHPREIQNFISANGNGFGLTMSSCVAVADWIDPSRDQAVYPILQGILLSSHKSCHGEGNWFHQKGSHYFHFSITSHPEGWKNGYNSAIANNHPLFVQQKDNKGGTLKENNSFLKLSDPFTALSLIKKADNDNNLIIRLTEMEGKDKNVTITLPISVKKVIRTNLIEEELEILPVSGHQFTLPLSHHAIETYKLIL